LKLDSVQHVTHFKVIRSNIEMAITPPWIARLRSNLVYRQHAANVQDHKVKGQGHSVK